MANGSLTSVAEVRYMDGLIQIQVTKEGDSNVIFGLDKSGQVWRGRLRMVKPGKHAIKWVVIEESDPPTGR